MFYTMLFIWEKKSLYKKLHNIIAKWEVNVSSQAYPSGGMSLQRKLLQQYVILPDFENKTEALSNQNCKGLTRLINSDRASRQSNREKIIFPSNGGGTVG